MSEYDGLYAGAHAVERYRQQRNPSAHRITAQRVVVARRELATVTHIPGDLSLEEIDRRFYAALRWFRWRRRADRAS